MKKQQQLDLIAKMLANIWYNVDIITSFVMSQKLLFFKEKMMCPQPQIAAIFFSIEFKSTACCIDVKWIF